MLSQLLELPDPIEHASTRATREHKQHETCCEQELEHTRAECRSTPSSPLSIEPEHVSWNGSIENAGLCSAQELRMVRTIADHITCLFLLLEAWNNHSGTNATNRHRGQNNSPITPLVSAPHKHNGTRLNLQQCFTRADGLGHITEHQGSMHRLHWSHRWQENVQSTYLSL